MFIDNMLIKMYFLPDGTMCFVINEVYRVEMQIEIGNGCDVFCRVRFVVVVSKL